ncbi:MAG: hypothetical protein AAF235_04385 [Planctomycetota bacterium]
MSDQERSGDTSGGPSGGPSGNPSGNGAGNDEGQQIETPSGVGSTLPRPRTEPPQQTTFNRAWLIRVVVMFIALLAFGAWGLFDALVAYPDRGERYASYAEYEYLSALQRADESEQPGLFPSRAGVENPVDELERLEDPDVFEKNTADAAGESSRSARAQMELARRGWLIALTRIGKMTPEFTTYGDEFGAVRARLSELEQRWTVESPPSPLAYWDITMQWVIVGVCWGFAAYIGFLFVRVATTNYVWDPATTRLKLPGGKSFVPDDIAEVDKRKWDKFLVVVAIKDSHPELGGKSIRFDTFRHARLEDWILTMESIAFPDAGDNAADNAGEIADAGAVSDGSESEPSEGSPAVPPPSA